MDIRDVVQLRHGLICLVVFSLSGCVTEPGPGLDTDEPETRDAALGNLEEELAKTQRNTSVMQDTLDILPCPEPPTNSPSDTELPKIQILVDPDPWPQGEWRCISVVFNNTSDQTYKHWYGLRCPGPGLHVSDPEQGPSPPLGLRSEAKMSGCVLENRTHEVHPGEMVRENFYWDGSIAWGTDGPYVEPGEQRLVAHLGQGASWDANATLTVTFIRGEVAPTSDCSRTPPPSDTPQSEPRVQILTPSYWSEEEWVCIEAVFLNTSNQTFEGRLSYYSIHFDVFAIGDDNESVELGPAMGGFLLGYPAMRDFSIAPGENVTTVVWWPPGLAEPGTYHLSAEFDNLVSANWSTENSTQVRVVGPIF